ncbi:hypothetical protein KPL71_001602 [Citrus sinensis]|uniref:Uncharacterized protein n=1 Tax=Citrus sinensis TaxID=2711 RepID=A0ACB8NZ27_CITSI|nr:hypothetical protein KPL71_001602 [Citrus sinensis]
MENLHYFYILSSLTFLLTMQLSFAADTVTTATFICDGEKLVSSSQRFELGFSSPGNSKHRCLGIGFKKSPDTVVWLLKAQNLVAQLLDTRNFVLGDNILVVVGDLNIVLELYLTSWRIADDPSPGNFSYRLDILIHGVTLNMYDSINISSVVILKVNLAGPVTHLIWNVMFSAPEGHLETSQDNLSTYEYPLQNQGKLFNGEEVVVERLSSQSGQGQEEFKNEMMCLALEYYYWEH